MVIFITLPDLHVIPLQVEANDTIDNVKALVTIEEGAPIIQQVLIFEGTELVNERTLSSYNIKNESTLQLILDHRKET